MAASSELRYRLLICQDSTVRTYVLEGDRWTVGRAQDCHLHIADKTASRKHLVIMRDEEGFHFRDLGGTNQTLLNGRAVREGRLEEGSTLMVGLTRLTLDSYEQEPKVQVVKTGGETALVFRHYLEEGDERSKGLVSVDQIDAITNFVERLTLASADFQTEEEVAKSYLEALLSQTRHRTGMIARFQGDVLKPLASIRRPDQENVQLPENLMHEMLVRPKALLLRDEKTPSASRILVPMGAGPGGLIMIEGPSEMAPPGKECLKLASSLAPLIWSRMLDTVSKSNLKAELEQLRYIRSGTSDTVLGSTRLLPLRKRLLQLAQRDDAVLLVGEEGCEAAELAHFLHANSRRSAGNFAKYSVGSLSSGRAARELFGKEPDSSGKPEGKPPIIAEAQGGTLFIDRPDALPPLLQQQLATIEQSGVLELPHRAPEAMNFRLVLGCRQVDNIDQGSKLDPSLQKVLGDPLMIPPLRSSTEDIFALAEQFLNEMGPGTSGAPRTLTEGAKLALGNYHWPGNVNELRQVLETSATRAGQQPIAPRHLPRMVASPESDPRQPNISPLNEVEKRHITAVLEAAQGNRAKAAQILGIANSTLYMKIRRHKIPVSDLEE
ncbi:MAG: FHA domain-containing protein [Planctomycetota bacterium]|jgi:DNA-binding NtrC family response regulator/pSer/pThr/pTyr-binding forkhead associated (FHA) protein